MTFLHNLQKSQRGDTLIEVLLAIAILSAVIVGAITMMSRGHAVALDSLERSQVTARMTEQSEILQYLRDSYDPDGPAPAAGDPASLWVDISTNRTASAENDACQVNSRPFYLSKTVNGAGQLVITVANFNVSTINESSANFVKTYAKPGDGMWIEAEMPATGSGGVRYIDFHIKGCWSPVGAGPLQQAKTIVRLYVP